MDTIKLLLEVQQRLADVRKTGLSYMADARIKRAQQHIAGAIALLEMSSIVRTSGTAGIK